MRTAPGVSWECYWTLELPQGSLVAEGPYFDKADSALAIIGGTGQCARARGQMMLHAINGGALYRFTYQVTG